MSPLAFDLAFDPDSFEWDSFGTDLSQPNYSDFQSTPYDIPGLASLRSVAHSSPTDSVVSSPAAIDSLPRVSTSNKRPSVSDPDDAPHTSHRRNPSFDTAITTRLTLPAKLKRSPVSPPDADYLPRGGASSRPRKESTSTHGIKTARVPHNLIERRYREHLNAQIDILRCTLPTSASNRPLDYAEDPQSGDLAARQVPKAAVIASAAETILKLRAEVGEQRQDKVELKEEVLRLRKMVKCAMMNVKLEQGEYTYGAGARTCE